MGLNNFKPYTRIVRHGYCWQVLKGFALCLLLLGLRATRSRFAFEYWSNKTPTTTSIHFLSIWRALSEGIVPLSILFLLWIYCNDHLSMNNKVKWVAPSKQFLWFNYILYSIHEKNKARFPPFFLVRSTLVIEPKKELIHTTIGLKLNIFEWATTHKFPVTTTQKRLL